MFGWANTTEENSEVTPHYPEEIAILPLRGTVAFPFIIMPLTIGLERSIKLVNDAVEKNTFIGLVVSKEPDEENPSPEKLYPIGVIAKIHRRLRSKDGSLQIIVQGIERFQVEHWLTAEPYLKAKITVIGDHLEKDQIVEIEALRRRITELAREIVHFMPQVPEEALNFLESAEDPRALLYTVAANTRQPVE